jgi:cytochrome c-type biogenesis protein CcmH
MLLWLAFALLAGLVVALVILPLAGARRGLPERAAYDRAVYRDQLAEIERDRARGLLSAAEAASARLEIERRLLGTAAEGEPSAPRTATSVSRLLVFALAIAVPLGAAGIYLLRGSPQLPDLPYAERGGERAAARSAGNRDLEQAVAALEAKLKETPDDAEGWLLLARTQQTLEHWEASGDAYKRALTLTGDRADIEASYGEMLFLAADGVVTPASREAFSAALARDPQHPAARYYLALADAQAGNAQAAIDAWQKLLADSPPGAGWIPTVRKRIEETAKAAGLPVPAPPAGAAGPSPDDLAAAANMTPEERAKMVRGMVERLAARLETQPGDLQGWLRLARAYEVLQEPQKAATAYERAAALAPTDASILAREVDALMEGRAPSDPIPESTIAVLKRLEALKPDEPRALWYLGLAAAQAHRPDEAKARWQKLLSLLPPESPEHKMVAEALAAISGGN